MACSLAKSLVAREQRLLDVLGIPSGPNLSQGRSEEVLGDKRAKASPRLRAEDGKRGKWSGLQLAIPG